MKKFVSLILVLTLVLTLAACGGETAPETTGAPETTAAPETTVPETTIPETTVPETTVPPATEPVAAFDPHWAGEEYEMPVPPVPFTDYSVKDGGGMYMIASRDSAEIAQLTAEDFAAYCDALIEAGFTDVADQSSGEDRYGQPYHHFLASSPDGMGVELYFEMGGGSMESEPSFVVIVILG